MYIFFFLDAANVVAFRRRMNSNRCTSNWVVLNFFSAARRFLLKETYSLSNQGAFGFTVIVLVTSGAWVSTIELNEELYQSRDVPC